METQMERTMIDEPNTPSTNFNTLFKSFLDLCRSDPAHLTGPEGLYEIAIFLTLRLLSPVFKDKEINLDDLEKYCYDREDSEEEEGLLELIKLADFESFYDFSLGKGHQSIYEKFDDLWVHVLSDHEDLKILFPRGNKTKIQSGETIQKIYKLFLKKEFENSDADILGDAYERVFSDTIFGASSKDKSEFGQFFTPSNIKRLLIHLVNPQVGEKIMDPACGTGTNYFIWVFRYFLDEWFKITIRTISAHFHTIFRLNHFTTIVPCICLQIHILSILMSTG